MLTESDNDKRNNDKRKLSCIIITALCEAALHDFWSSMLHVKLHRMIMNVWQPYLRFCTESVTAMSAHMYDAKPCCFWMWNKVWLSKHSLAHLSVQWWCIPAYWSAVRLVSCVWVMCRIHRILYCCATCVISVHQCHYCAACIAFLPLCDLRHKCHHFAACIAYFTVVRLASYGHFCAASIAHDTGIMLACTTNVALVLLASHMWILQCLHHTRCDCNVSAILNA